MDGSRGVWSWASGILGVVCLALVALNLWLPRPDEPAPAQASVAELAPVPEFDRAGPSAGTTDIAAHRRDGGMGQNAPGNADKGEPAVGWMRRSSPPESGGQRGAKPPGQGGYPATQSSGRQEVATGAAAESQEFVPKSHTEPERQNVKTLGYVQTADGRVRAVIGQGEWIQLVTEGQVLADNSRVAKITPTTIEIVRKNETEATVRSAARRRVATVPSAAPEPPSPPAATEDAPSAASETEVADLPGRSADVPMASAHAQGLLPHEAEAEASVASSWRLPAARPEPRLAGAAKPAAAGLPTDAALPSSPFQHAAGPSKPLGFVQKADGTTLTVMADGDSVRFEEQLEIASVAPASLPADMGVNPLQTISDIPMRLPSPREPFGGPGKGNSAPVILRALGYVERTGGQRQAILDDGDSVQLVEEGQVLGDGSRVLRVTPTSAEVVFEPTEVPPAMPAREQDFAALAMAGADGPLRPRAPPQDASVAPSKPLARARGMPAIVTCAALTRPPPHEARDWIERQWQERPATGAWRTSTTAECLPASTRARASPAPYGRGEGEVCPKSTPAAAEDEPCTRPEREWVPSLGFVEWEGGRFQTVINQGDGVELVEQGQTLADGSRVLAVSPNSVEISRLAASSDSRPASGRGRVGDSKKLPATAGRATENRASAGEVLSSPTGSSAGGFSSMSGSRGPGDIVTDTQPVGLHGLLLNWPVRNNRDEPRK